MGLAFPDLYEIGMSHLGLNLLYHAVNQRPGIVAERVFLPDMDLASVLQDRDIPLTTLESNTPLVRLDILGFTLAYELTYTNVLAILDLGRIPLRTEARSREHPLILAGGPCAFNPEPMSAFIDAFVIGEAEDCLPDLCGLVSSWKQSGECRQALLKALDRLEGLYVPSLYDWEQQGERKVWHLKPTTDRKGPVRKCTVPDLDAAFYPDRPLVPFTRIVHDRISLEVARGCPHGCRFCQAGNLYRPYRERSHERIHELAMQSLKTTGYEELSLLSLSIGDYAGIGRLIPSLMGKFEPQRVSLSLPSIRVGSLEPSVAKEILRVRKTGFTLAPEAASPRLRGVINKDIDEEELFRTAQMLAGLGWRSLKLYFMIGLPTEEESDVESIVLLARELRKRVRKSKRPPLQITVNVSTFVPKPHTPFQWEAQQSREGAERKQAFLRKHLRRPGFRLKWHDPRLSLLEGIFARGNRNLCDSLEAAYRLGCRLDGWTEHMRFDLWQKAFEQTGLSPESCLHPFADPEDPLPWDWIDTGMDKRFLAREFERAQRGVLTPFHCTGRCEACSLCGRKDEPGAVRTPTPPLEDRDAAIRGAEKSLPDLLPGDRATNHPRLRVSYAKRSGMACLSHLETINVFYRALRRSRLPIAYTVGEHPHPKVAFGPALPVGVESHAEYMDLWFSGAVGKETVAESLRTVLPEGFALLGVAVVPQQAPSLEESVQWMEYETTFVQDGVGTPSRMDLNDVLVAFRNAEIMEKDPETGSCPTPRALKHLSELDVLESRPGLRLRLMRLSGSIPSPFKVLGFLFCDPQWKGLRFNIRKTRTAFTNTPDPARFEQGAVRQEDGEHHA